MKKKIAIEIQTSEDGRYCFNCDWNDGVTCLIWDEKIWGGVKCRLVRLSKCKGAEKRMQNALSKAYKRATCYNRP